MVTRQDKATDPEPFRIWLIADDDETRTSLEQALNQHYSLEIISDPIAIPSIAPPPNLILSAMQRTGLSNAELVQQLRAATPLDVPIILLAIEGAGNRIAAWEAGADDSLTLPCATDELLACVNAHLQRSQRQRLQHHKDTHQHHTQTLHHQYFQQVADTTPGFIYVYDLVEQHNVYVNRQVTTVLGYTPEQIQTMGSALLPHLLHPEDFAQLPTHLLQFHTLEPGKVLELEYRMQHANGEWRWFVSRDVVFSYDADGSIRQILGHIYDITDRKHSEETLRCEKERFELAAAAVNCLIYDWDVATNIVSRTDGLTRIFGYSLAEAEPTLEWWTERVHPEDLLRLNTQSTSTLATQNRYAMEYRVRNQAGEYVYVLDQGLRLRDATGNVFRVVGSTTDISAAKRDEAVRKQAEADLRDSEERFRAMFNQAAVGISQVGLEGRYIAVNSALCKITGYSDTDLHQMSYRDLTHPEDLPQELAQVDRLLAREIQNFTIEKRYLRQDGTLIWVSLTTSMVWNEQGQPKYAIGIVQDISDRRRSELERKQADANQRFLIAASTLLAASLDYETTLSNVVNLVVPTLADCCIVDIFRDDGTLEQLTIACHDSAQQATLDQLRQHYPPPKEHPVMQRLRQGESVLHPTFPDFLITAIVQSDSHALMPDVTLHSTMAIPLLSRDRVFGIIWFVLTQTDRQYQPADLALAEDIARRMATAIDNARLYSETQKANRIKDEFLAVLSHELRTPLNPILGWTRLLRTRRFNAEATDRALETIERNALLQTQLIEDLLDISRILQGKLSLRVCPVNLVSVIEAAMETMFLAADAKSIHFEFQVLAHPSPANSIPNSTAGNLEDTPTFFVLGDPNRLQQVIWNLLSNAVKFTAVGGRIEIRIERVDLNSKDKGETGTSLAQIRVSDTGSGIDPEFLPYVFDYFRQADSTTTRSVGGMGLGLAIVRHLVELHGGVVQAASAGEGEGATFVVRLPLMQQESGQKIYSRDATSLSDMDSLPLQGLRVLAVDDDPDSREFVKYMLEQYGAMVTPAASAMEAIEVLSTLHGSAAHPPFHILVSDIGMPDLNGYDLIRQVRSLESSLGETIKAIALTAYAREGDQQQTIAAGYQTHLAKPVIPAQLVAAILELIAQ